MATQIFIADAVSREIVGYLNNSGIYSWDNKDTYVLDEFIKIDGEKRIQGLDTVALVAQDYVGGDAGVSGAAGIQDVVDTLTGDYSDEENPVNPTPRTYRFSLSDWDAIELV